MPNIALSQKSVGKTVKTPKNLYKRGGNGNPQYEVQTTTDINDASSWESLPIGTDPNLRFYRIREITQDPQ